jgi:hypothetical protein
MGTSLRGCLVFNVEASMRRLRLVQITAAVVCAVGVLSGCASRAGVRAADGADQLIGIHWELVSSIDHASDSAPVSAAPDTWIEFSSSHQITGRDGCAGFQADAADSGSTVTVSDVLGAANGCLSDHGVLDATRTAVGMLLDGQPIGVAVSANRLTLTVGNYTLLYRNTGPASPPAAADTSTTRTADVGSQGSCVAPFLRADPTRSPPAPGHPTSLGEVAAGHSITVYGWWYYDGPCIDVSKPGQTIPPAHPGGAVTVLLTTADGQTATLATAQPRGDDASFAATANIPDNAPLGPATVSDQLGHQVELTIVAS